MATNFLVDTSQRETWITCLRAWLRKHCRAELSEIAAADVLARALCGLGEQQITLDDKVRSTAVRRLHSGLRSARVSVALTQANKAFAALFELNEHALSQAAANGAITLSFVEPTTRAFRLQFQSERLLSFEEAQDTTFCIGATFRQPSPFQEGLHFQVNPPIPHPHIDPETFATRTQNYLDRGGISQGQISGRVEAFDLEGSIDAIAKATSTLLRTAFAKLSPEVELNIDGEAALFMRFGVIQFANNQS